jgi:predicted nuclease of restriction endonuclease-like (RecB) superfamily
MSNGHFRGNRTPESAAPIPHTTKPLAMVTVPRRSKMGKTGLDLWSLLVSKSSLLPEGYDAFVRGLKERIRSAQVKAALAVNQELILLYWQIGRDILSRQQEQGWGAKVIERLSQDLKHEFPDGSGFSSRNLKYMRAFAEAYPDEALVQRSVALMPWRHNIVLLEKLKSSDERLWYAQKSLENGWSRDVLAMQVESGLYYRQGKAITNFERTLPKPQSDLAQNLLKDPYNLQFLTLAENAQERDLERALIGRIRDFLLELGVGFAYVGSQYRLEVDGDEFFADLLFYHLNLRCFVVIDLKMAAFKPEYSGQMNFYVSVIDDQLRRSDDQPTIGIVLCRDKKKSVVEYALRNINSPIAVATHCLPQQLVNNLPTVEQLEMEMESVIAEIEGADDPPVS